MAPKTRQNRNRAELIGAGSVQRKAAHTSSWTEINKDLASEFKKHEKKNRSQFLLAVL